MSRAVFLILSILLTAAGATALPLDFDYNVGRRDFFFDRHRATLEPTIHAFSESRIGSPDPFVDVWVSYESGDLRALRPEVEGGVHYTTTYRYAPGLLTFQVSYEQSGVLEIGTFTARTLALTFVVEGEDERDTPACRWCSFAWIDIALGRGQFDSDLALLLGVPQRTTGGMLSLFREDIYEGLDERRRGYANGGRLSIVPAASVPEPGPLWLSAIAVPCFWAWRRRVRKGGME